jgi:hypothetical protein
MVHYIGLDVSLKQTSICPNVPQNWSEGLPLGPSNDSMSRRYRRPQFASLPPFGRFFYGKNYAPSFA